VRHNTKQGLTVIAIFFGPVLLILAFLVHRSAQSDINAFRTAIQDSMHSCYEFALTNNSGGSNDTLSPITSEQLSFAFNNPNQRSLSLSGFGPTVNVWVSRDSVNRQTTNLWCVLQLSDKQLYGIDGKGNFSDVPEKEFADWPHVPARIPAK
jgi:hypothetical protein